jgi:hypothetical protein
MAEHTQNTVSQNGLDAALTTILGVLRRSALAPAENDVPVSDNVALLEASVQVVGSVATDLKRIADALESIDRHGLRT